MGSCPENTSHDPIRIVLVANGGLRQELARLLADEDGVWIVGESGCLKQILESQHEQQPDVVLLDLDSPEMEANPVVRQIRLKFLRSKIVVITAPGQDDVVVEAFKQGADGHLTRETAELASIGQVIRAVSKGETILSPHIAGRIMDEMQHIKQSRQG